MALGSAALPASSREADGRRTGQKHVPGAERPAGEKAAAPAAAPRARILAAFIVRRSSRPPVV